VATVRRRTSNAPTSQVLTTKQLSRARPGHVDFIDVPDFGYLMVVGEGDPNGPQFASAVRALYAVSYAAHFIAKDRFGDAPPVMPLEALWWTATNTAPPDSTVMWLPPADRSQWRWQAMIAQIPPIEESVIADAIDRVAAKGSVQAETLRFRHWAEGRCAQLLHEGPYADEAATIATLHMAIEAAGCEPRGRHHEIYVSDPRRTDQHRLRTVQRQPISQKPSRRLAQPSAS
jgi:hypothetical protein